MKWLNILHLTSDFFDYSHTSKKFTFTSKTEFNLFSILQYILFVCFTYRCYYCVEKASSDQTIFQNQNINIYSLIQISFKNYYLSSSVVFL